MRVTTGTAKGRRLLSPKSNKIRPALSQVKEAIFNILFDVRDFHVLDLFAGTGSMGIEALSRGASHTTFVDDFRPAIELIKKNVALCNFSNLATIIKSPVNAAIRRFARQGKTFDLVFVDPPYLKKLVNPTLRLLAEGKIIKPSSIIIVEHHPKEPILQQTNLDITDSRRYGQTLVTFLKRSKLI